MADGIIKSQFPDVDIPESNLTDFMFSKVDELGDAPFLVEGATGRELKFSELKGLVRRFSAGLTKRGFKKGDVMAIYSPNILEYAVVFHGVVSIGGILTTANPLYTAVELEHQLKDAGATYLICFPAFAKSALEAAAKCNIKDVFVFGNEAVDGCSLYSSLIDNDGSECPKVDIDAKNDIAVLPYSSGTTGLPKGVMITHYNIVANICQFTHKDLVQLTPEDTLIGLLPFFHIYGMIVILNAALYNGSKVVVMPKFEPVQFLELLSKYKVTIAHVVPPIVLFLAKHPLVEKYDLSGLREILSGAAPLGKELTQAAVDRLKLKNFRQGWGMTELSPVGLVTPDEGGKYGSAGKLVPNQEAKLIDVATKQPVEGPNKEGELWVRGPNVMKGYLNNEDATKHTIDDDGFLHTGDIGYVDEDGNFFISDRLKELIKYKGFQVPPAELEALLLAFPKVADAAVIPVPDAQAGELPKAYIVKKDPSLTAEEVMEHIAKQVAPHKKIRLVEFTDSIPKSASGKILRRKLRALEKERAEKALAEQMAQGK